VILRVGLTGGIASGKSTIVRMLAALGCKTVDADAIVSRLYQPGEAGHDAIVRTYGSDILRPDGEIDRKKLADIAFSKPEESRKLNALIHPIVVAEQARLFREAEERGEDAIYVVEATLLLESGGRQRFDRIVVVDVDPEVQVARAVGRGMTADEATRRIAHQMARDERLSHADYVIDNSGDERQALVEATRIYDLLQRDLEAKKKSPGLAPGADSRMDAN
jgi:dephospho-CoA kinase